MYIDVFFKSKHRDFGHVVGRYMIYIQCIMMVIFLHLLVKDKWENYLFSLT